MNEDRPNEDGSGWALQVEQDGRTRQFGAADMPVSLGGQSSDDIRLPGVGESVNIGMLDDVFFAQPRKNSHNARLNGERLTGSRRLVDGDEIALDSARLACHVAPGRLSLVVKSRLVAGDTAPPDLEDLARASTFSSEEVRIAPVSFRAGEEAEARTGFRPSRAFVGLASVFAVLAVCGWFAFTAKSVAIDITPGPEDVSLPGTLFKLKVGDRYLLRTGTHELTASLPGYYPLETTIDVGQSQDQFFRLDMKKLPGVLDFETDPAVAASVSIAGGRELGVVPISDIDIEPGQYEFVFSADRYVEEIVEVEVEGGGVRQTVSVDLTPNWAPVTLSTQPAGGEVFVDGEAVGTTPAELEIEQGTHEIEVRLRGYNAWREEIDVVAAQPLALPAVNLVAADGRIELVSEPGEASVTVNGEFAGRTPLDLSLRPGRTHQIVLSKPGHEAVIRELSVAADSGRRVNIELPVVYGQVGVVTEPQGAQIFVDEKLAGTTPATLRLMTVPHSIVVRLEGYAQASDDVTPRPDYALALDFELEKLNEMTGDGFPTVIETSQEQSLRVVPSGRFTMGTSRREAGRRSNEVLREVELSSAFYLGTHEVTNAEFREFFPDHDSGTFAGESLNEDDQPVVNVSWGQVAEYLNKLSIRDELQPVYQETASGWIATRPYRNGYRLPTEAEWAWAARYGGRDAPQLYPWGDGMPPPDRTGNYADIAASNELPTTLLTYNDGFIVSAPVGSFARDPLGMYDLGGNVSEWTQDVYELLVPSADAQVITDPLGPESGPSHVLRGSSWKSATVTDLRTAYRNYSSEAREDLGFRIARNLRLQPAPPEAEAAQEADSEDGSGAAEDAQDEDTEGDNNGDRRPVQIRTGIGI